MAHAPADLSLVSLSFLCHASLSTCMVTPRAPALCDYGCLQSWRAHVGLDHAPHRMVLVAARAGGRAALVLRLLREGQTQHQHIQWLRILAMRSCNHE